MIESELIAGLAKGDHKCLEYVYRVHRPAFLGFARKHFSNLSEADVVDAFQDTVIAACKNFALGRTLNDDTKFQSYLFTIGKNKLVDKVKRNSRAVTFTALGEINLQSIAEQEMEGSDEAENKELVRKYLSLLGDDCRTIIELFYFQRLSMVEIAQEMGYSDGNGAKKKKSICLKKLRDLIDQGNGFSKEK